MGIAVLAHKLEALAGAKVYLSHPLSVDVVEFLNGDASFLADGQLVEPVAGAGTAAIIEHGASVGCQGGCGNHLAGLLYLADGVTVEVHLIEAYGVFVLCHDKAEAVVGEQHVLDRWVEIAGEGFYILAVTVKQIQLIFKLVGCQLFG